MKDMDYRCNYLIYICTCITASNYSANKTIEPPPPTPTTFVLHKCAMTNENHLIRRMPTVDRRDATSPRAKYENCALAFLTISLFISNFKH